MSKVASHYAIFADGWQPQRIAILRALQLGDLLLAVPALRALRQRFRDAEITLIGLPWAASFVQRFSHYVDRFVEFPGYPGIREAGVDHERTARFIAEQQAYDYDLALQMHGSGQASNPFTLALGADVTAGYYTGKRPPALALAAPYPDSEPEIQRNLGLALMLGCEACAPDLEFPLFAADHAEAAALLARLPKRGQPLVGVHAGARSPARCWPPEYFAAVADELARRHDARIILTGGPGEEATARAVCERMTAEPLVVAGETSLGGLAALIDALDLFISNDTGPAHLAEAVGTSSVSIFGPADAVRWAPLDTMRHPIVRRPVACSPCGYWECPIDHRCLRWLAPNQVIAAANTLLETGVVACNA